jgi:hypothetical protein
MALQPEGGRLDRIQATTRSDAPAKGSERLPRPFRIDLYTPAAFVSQATTTFCIPASLLTMMNMIDGRSVDSFAAQERLYDQARRFSTWRLRGDGAEAEGWARTLNDHGYGPYVVHVSRTRTAAIATAARALRQTGRPVGLMMWRGAHAWVMSGFRATADPRVSSDFRVTHVVVSDPWYPRVSSIWGPSRPPDAVVPADELGDDFLAFDRPLMSYPDKDGRFVLVLPVLRR